MATIRSEMYLWPFNSLYLTNYVAHLLEFYLRTHKYMLRFKLCLMPIKTLLRKVFSTFFTYFGLQFGNDNPDGSQPVLDKLLYVIFVCGKFEVCIF